MNHLMLSRGMINMVAKKKYPIKLNLFKSPVIKGMVGLGLASLTGQTLSREITDFRLMFDNIHLTTPATQGDVYIMYLFSVITVLMTLLFLGVFIWSVKLMFSSLIDQEKMANKYGASYNM